MSHQVVTHISLCLGNFCPDAVYKSPSGVSMRLSSYPFYSSAPHLCQKRDGHYAATAMQPFGRESNGERSRQQEWQLPFQPTSCCYCPNKCLRIGKIIKYMPSQQIMGSALQSDIRQSACACIRHHRCFILDPAKPVLQLRHSIVPITCPIGISNRDTRIPITTANHLRWTRYGNIPPSDTTLQLVSLFLPSAAAVSSLLLFNHPLHSSVSPPLNVSCPSAHSEPDMHGPARQNSWSAAVELSPRMTARPIHGALNHCTSHSPSLNTPQGRPQELWCWLCMRQFPSLYTP